MNVLQWTFDPRIILSRGGGGSRRFDSFLDIYDVMVRKGTQETNAWKQELDDHPCVSSGSALSWNTWMVTRKATQYGASWQTFSLLVLCRYFASRNSFQFSVAVLLSNIFLFFMPLHINVCTSFALLQESNLSYTAMMCVSACTCNSVFASYFTLETCSRLFTINLRVFCLNARFWFVWILWQSSVFEITWAVISINSCTVANNCNADTLKYRFIRNDCRGSNNLSYTINLR